jgi:hypothetical protein
VIHVAVMHVADVRVLMDITDVDVAWPRNVNVARRGDLASGEDWRWIGFRRDCRSSDALWGALRRRNRSGKGHGRLLARGPLYDCRGVRWNGGRALGGWRWSINRGGGSEPFTICRFETRQDVRHGASRFRARG